ncbi:MAG: response regulator [Acidimicrobiia bacterium]
MDSFPTISDVESRRILIVDDEPELRTMLGRYLRAEGFIVEESATGSEALDSVSVSPPDVVLLDVGLPDIDGFEVLRRIRIDSDVPVVMLTARAEEIDRVVGLTVGADDYVSKPFSPRELVARINAILRRGRMDGRGTDDRLIFSGLVIDLAAREVLRDGEKVELSALNFELLAALAGSPHRVFTRAQLLERVWGWDYFGVERVVDVHIGNLRKTLGDDANQPRFISTVRGVGYRFVGSSE